MGPKRVDLTLRAAQVRPTLRYILDGSIESLKLERYCRRVTRQGRQDNRSPRVRLRCVRCADTLISGVSDCALSFIERGKELGKDNDNRKSNTNSKNDHHNRTSNDTAEHNLNRYRYPDSQIARCSQCLCGD